MKNTYYREKLIKLVDVLFLETGDARSKFLKNEKFFENVYLASQTTDEETRNRWEVVFRELNTKEELNLGNRQFSSYSMTVQSKRNSSLKKYLEFILEEFYKVL